MWSEVRVYVFVANLAVNKTDVPVAGSHFEYILTVLFACFSLFFLTFRYSFCFFTPFGSIAILYPGPSAG
jgi:hypothetical protein